MLKGSEHQAPEKYEGRAVNKSLSPHPATHPLRLRETLRSAAVGVVLAVPVSLVAGGFYVAVQSILRVDAPPLGAVLGYCTLAGVVGGCVLGVLASQSDQRPAAPVTFAPPTAAKRRRRAIMPPAIRIRLRGIFPGHHGDESGDPSLN
jgi:hypothetical protein